MEEQGNQDERSRDNRRSAATTAVTSQVAAFRRAARLAMANPLQFSPAGPLSVLQSLESAFVGLIDATPFARLRDALTAPAAPATTVSNGVSSLSRATINDRPGAARSAAATNNTTGAGKSKTNPPDATLAQRRLAARSSASTAALASTLRSAPSRDANTTSTNHADNHADNHAVLKPLTDFIAGNIDRAAQAITNRVPGSDASTIAGDIARTTADIINKSIGALSGAAASNTTKRKSPGAPASATPTDRTMADLVSAILASVGNTPDRAPNSTIGRIVDAPGDFARITSDLITKGVAALAPNKSRPPRRSGFANLISAELRRALADINKKADQTGAVPAADRAPVTPAIPAPAVNSAGDTRATSATDTHAEDLFEALYRGGVDLSWP